MKQKDYKAISKIIRKRRLLISKEDYKDMTNDFANYFEKISLYQKDKFVKEFNRKQFLKDCGVEQ